RPVLAPAIPYGVSTLAVGWPGTVSLSIPTLRRLIVEVVRGLASHGFRRFVLTNYQADPDHLAPIAQARRARARFRVRSLVGGAGVRAGGEAADADGQSPGRGAHAEPESQRRVAFGRARNGDDAVGRAGAGPPGARPAAGAGVVRLSARARARRAQFSRPRPG